MVYFLHGTDYPYQVYWAFFGFVSTLDQLIAAGTIPPCIFLTPHGLVDPYNGSWWSNSALYGDFEDYVVEDLVAHVDATYRTRPARHHRVIMGLSMGGYGSLRIGLEHPDVFHSVASYSGSAGAFDLLMDIYRPLILDEHGGVPPYSWDAPAGWGGYSMDTFSMAGAWSANAANPSGVDFPLDEWGNIRPDVMDRWYENDPVNLISQIPVECAPKLYLDVGMSDEWFFYDTNQAFVAALDEAGFDYVFESFDGGHFDRFHERFPIGLEHAFRPDGDDTFELCYEFEGRTRAPSCDRSNRACLRRRSHGSRRIRTRSASRPRSRST